MVGVDVVEVAPIIRSEFMDERAVDHECSSQ
jgi:hypothetical protein